MKKYVLIIFIIIIWVGIYKIYVNEKNYQGSGTFVGNLNQTLNNGEYKKAIKEIFVPDKTNWRNYVKLHEVKSLGYNFFIGEIESPGVTNINDDLKNEIIKIAHNSDFPASLLRNTPVVILNNLALIDNQYVGIDGVNLKVPELTAEFLSEGAIYVKFTDKYSVIFINKTSLSKGDLRGVLTHEFGHVIGSKLSVHDWVDFYKFRNIPSLTATHTPQWESSSDEDFAEVYKNIFTGVSIQTKFGRVKNSTEIKAFLIVILNKFD